MMTTGKFSIYASHLNHKVNFNPFQTWIDVNGEQIEIPYNAGDYKLASNFNIDIK